MKTVIIIEEDSHGLIGIAKDYSSAIDLLVNEKWLNEDYEIWVDDSSISALTQTIKDHLGELWYVAIRDEWDIGQFNDFFDGSFYLAIEEIYGAE